MKHYNSQCNKSILVGLSLFAALSGTHSIAQEQGLDWDPWVKLAVSSREQNHRPGNNSLSADSWLAEARLAVSGQAMGHAKWSWKIDARAQTSGSNALLFDDDNDLFREQNSGDNYFLQLREAWVRYHGLTSLPGEYLTLGLQRLYDGHGLWWDTDIESLTWQGDTTQLDWLVAVGQEFDTYRTNADLVTRAEDTVRWFGKVEWDWTAYHELGVKVMQSSQSLSDLTIARRDTAMGVNADSLWLGVHVSSGWERRNPKGLIAYKLEWIMQQGESLQSLDGIALTQLDIDANAIDAGIRFDFEKMSFGAMYTRGSGGGTAEKSELFSQTGIHSNRSRSFGNRQIVHRFNEAFRPDISNLTYSGIFVSWALNQRWESVLLAGHYQKTDGASPIFVGGRSIAVVNGNVDVGNSVDLNLTYYPEDGDFYNLNVLRLRAGVFEPDSGLLNQDRDYRITLESQFRY